MIVHNVSSLALPSLEPYRTLRRPEDHKQRGIFVAEGALVVRRLLQSPLKVQSLLVTPEWELQLRPFLKRPEFAGVEVFVAPAAMFRQLVGFRFHQGVMAVARIPPAPSLDSVPQPHLLLALDTLHHVENVGVIARNCAGLGADGLLVSGTSCSPFLRRAVRNSMGAVFSLPVYHVGSISEALRELQSTRNTRIVVTNPRSGNRLWEVDFTGNVCCVMGNEESGVEEEIRSLADCHAVIPMHRETDSLNVANAAAIVLYEAAVQRHGGPRVGVAH